jgi:hypothetical protein
MTSRVNEKYRQHLDAERGMSAIVAVLSVAVIIGLVLLGLWLYRPLPSINDAATSEPPSAELANSARAVQGTRAVSESDEPKVATSAAFSEAIGKLLSGVPEFPAFPGANLTGSAAQALKGTTPKAFRIKWTTTEPVPAVMAWYQKTLSEQGWSYVAPDSDASIVEQVARISKGNVEGFVAAEETDGLTEIVVSIQTK